MIAVFLAYWGLMEVLQTKAKPNPLSPGVKISYPLPRLPNETVTHYDKGPLDLYFLAFYVVVFSFIRQSVTEYVLRPFAKSQGIKGESKLLRFMEQGYAFLYFSVFGSLGLVSLSLWHLIIWLTFFSGSCQTNRHGGTRQINSGSTGLTTASDQKSRHTTFCNSPIGCNRCLFLF